jgi:hypothetical protein
MAKFDIGQQPPEQDTLVTGATITELAAWQKLTYCRSAKKRKEARAICAALPMIMRAADPPEAFGGAKLKGQQEASISKGATIFEGAV